MRVANIAECRSGHIAAGNAAIVAADIAAGINATPVAIKWRCVDCGRHNLWIYHWRRSYLRQAGASIRSRCQLCKYNCAYQQAAN